MQRKLSNFWLRPVHDVCPSELAIWMVRRTPTDIGAAGFQDFLGGLSVGGVGLIASMGAEIGSLRALSVRDRLGTCVVSAWAHGAAIVFGVSEHHELLSRIGDPLELPLPSRCRRMLSTRCA